MIPVLAVNLGNPSWLSKIDISKKQLSKCYDLRHFLLFPLPSLIFENSFHSFQFSLPSDSLGPECLTSGLFRCPVSPTHLAVFPAYHRCVKLWKAMIRTIILKSHFYLVYILLKMTQWTDVYKKGTKVYISAFKDKKNLHLVNFSGSPLIFLEY